MATAREPTNRPDTYQRLPLATPISHLRTAAGTYIGLGDRLHQSRVRRHMARSEAGNLRQNGPPIDAREQVFFDTKRDTGGFRTASYSVRKIWNATSKAPLTGPHESAAMTCLPVPLPETTRQPPSHKDPALWRHWPARPERRPLYDPTSKPAAEQKVCCRPGRYRTRTFRRRHTLLLPDILTLNDDCPADLYWGMVWNGPIRRTLA